MKIIKLNESQLKRLIETAPSYNSSLVEYPGASFVSNGGTLTDIEGEPDEMHNLTADEYQDEQTPQFPFANNSYYGRR